LSQASARKMTRMRSRLVHLYWEVDANILYDILQNNTSDFDRFKAYVYGYMCALKQENEHWAPLSPFALYSGMSFRFSYANQLSVPFQ